MMKYIFCTLSSFVIFGLLENQVYAVDSNNNESSQAAYSNTLQIAAETTEAIIPDSDSSSPIELTWEQGKLVNLTGQTTISLHVGDSFQVSIQNPTTDTYFNSSAPNRVYVASESMSGTWDFWYWSYWNHTDVIDDVTTNLNLVRFTSSISGCFYLFSDTGDPFVFSFIAKHPGEKTITFEVKETEHTPDHETRINNNVFNSSNSYTFSLVVIVAN